MILEQYEINTILDALDKHSSDELYGNVIDEQIIDKLKKIQSQSNNKRYSIRSTDWLSEAAKKRKRKNKYGLSDESLL